jgi:hypothetical protein
MKLKTGGGVLYNAIQKKKSITLHTTNPQEQTTNPLKSKQTKTKNETTKASE